MDQESADASSGSRVIIVGVDHQLQDPDVRTNLPKFEAQDKDLFRDFLRFLVRDRLASFIGEEYLPSIKTIAQEVAAELGVRYERVDMPRDKRESLDIPANYSTDQKLQPKLKAEYHRVREVYMVERTEEFAPDIGSRIVICGLVHLAGLYELFSARCYAVESINVEKKRPELDLDLRWLERHFWSRPT